MANLGLAGEIAVEAFTCLLVFKNIFSFGLTWSAYDWIKGGGTSISRTFYIIASVQVGVCLLSIPMCMCDRPLTHRSMLFH